MCGEVEGRRGEGWFVYPLFGALGENQSFDLPIHLFIRVIFHPTNIKNLVYVMEKEMATHSSILA